MTLLTVCAPRQVLNVIDHTCRDLRVADEARAGRFTLCGVALDLGPVPDWNLDPYPPDKEWRIEWVKFYFGLDLAHAFATTGEAAYAGAWARLVESFATQRRPGEDDSEVIARRVQNWIYAWNRLTAVDDEAVDVGLASRLVPFLWAEVLHVRDHLSGERNHRTLELYALLLASVAFPDLDAEHALRRLALDELTDNLLQDVRPDGGHREASPHYHCVALRSWLGAVRLARDAGIELPAAYHARVTAACEFALHTHRPDGRIPAFSDADNESYRDVLALAATIYDRPDWRWGATLGRCGRPPQRHHVSFADVGYHVQRSGWGAGAAFEHERFLMFDCGPLGDGGHGHYDALSVEVFGNGRPLVVDPGRFTYSESGANWRRWFKSTAAHNTVTVDGLDQTPYARRKPRGVRADARLCWRASAPDFDVMCGEATSPCYEVRHVRTVLFVAGEYWIVVDDLIGRRPHHYALRWHGAPDASAVLADRPARAEIGEAVLTFTPARPIRLEPGWYAPSYGLKLPAPIVVVESKAQSTTFATVIDPRPAATRRVPLCAAFLSRGQAPDDRVVFEVRGLGPKGDERDLVTWAATAGFLDLEGFRGVARAAVVRRGAAGGALALTAADVVHGSWRDGRRRDRIGPLADGAWVSWRAASGSWSVGRTSA